MNKFIKLQVALLILSAFLLPTHNSFAATSNSGKIYLQVEKNGVAWYISPVNNYRYYLGRPADAFNVMRNLGLGTPNSTLAQIPVGLLNWQRIL